MVVCLYILWELLRIFRSDHHSWNRVAAEYWYVLTMWTLAGFMTMIQGIALDRPLTPALVFISAAALVGVKAAHSKEKPIVE